jgi:hypothetical protein
MKQTCFRSFEHLADNYSEDKKMVEKVKDDLELGTVPLDAPDLVIAHLLHFTLESHLFLLWGQQHKTVRIEHT